MDMVKQKYLEQNIPCLCTYCLNQVVKTWQEVKDDLLIHRMSPTYTTWIHHGEEGGGTDIIEPSDVHGSHHDGSITEEEEQEDCDNNILPDFDDLVKTLLSRGRNHSKHVVQVGVRVWGHRWLGWTQEHKNHTEKMQCFILV